MYIYNNITKNNIFTNFHYYRKRLYSMFVSTKYVSTTVIMFVSTTVIMFVSTTVIMFVSTTVMFLQRL